MGNKGMVTGSIYDLRSETSGKGAAVDSGCSEDDLVGAIRQMVARISE